VIGDGCKIDNLVQVAHNCNIGACSVLAGCTGIAGSVTLGEHCIVGGAGMISGHVTLAPGTTISGGSLVMKNIARPGLYTSVFPIDTTTNGCATPPISVACRTSRSVFQNLRKN
jgi:UDP-3-O-[3-hydroxymyristoyl] glucosamine N-acyltransferase